MNDLLFDIYVNVNLSYNILLNIVYNIIAITSYTFIINVYIVRDFKNIFKHKVHRTLIFCTVIYIIWSNQDTNIRYNRLKIKHISLTLQSLQSISAVF